MIAIACDHAGIDLKPHVIAVLDELGIPYKDLGTNSHESVDYPVYGARAAKAVASGECDRGIVMCGTGVGIAMAASKIPGIRCVNCTDTYSAKMSRMHNNANILSLGARVVGSELAKDIVRIWLTTDFEGERHARRVGLLDKLDRGEALE
ncbi:MAG: ribose 5-phosphate isomerase B [Clostridiales bacterium]|nr:ribose 5-phosphate isomerase B [Clostridiales bacterium]MDO4349885.1 ribose 5-phosphate isomerase B [Eubacteriales bacterium]MDY4007655.1 ribose 5-phosphate isomerase B [Candidatus Limiplasma sp.]